ncbi:hypothetical protein NDU88_009492 [Pleurodeles waltl]|uniref:Uncharacterized protein n=1 Tax=Pleurodeles waltl TaxID=8319 RepID=A0AAV7QRN9_PLEWA|nr:hypothetical protein NDU88_009492 [Pleurodeles waltl]
MLHCLSVLVRRHKTWMPARGSKSAPTGVGAEAAARQDRTRGSGGAGECKVVRASTRIAGETDKTKSASLAKLVSAPLRKYFKTKTHADLAGKQKETTGNSIDIGGIVESNANISSGDYVIEQEERKIHKESSQTVNADVPLTPVRIHLSIEEAEEGRKSETSNHSAPRDTLAQAEAQALTQALVHDLSSLNMGEKVQQGDPQRELIPKNGQDLDLGDRFFSLSDQSSGLVMKLLNPGKRAVRLGNHPGPKQSLRQLRRVRMKMRSLNGEKGQVNLKALRRLRLEKR